MSRKQILGTHQKFVMAIFRYKFIRRPGSQIYVQRYFLTQHSLHNFPFTLTLGFPAVTLFSIHSASFHNVLVSARSNYFLIVSSGFFIVFTRFHCISLGFSRAGTRNHEKPKELQ